MTNYNKKLNAEFAIHFNGGLFDSRELVEKFKDDIVDAICDLCNKYGLDAGVIDPNKESMLTTQHKDYKQVKDIKSEVVLQLLEVSGYDIVEVARILEEVQGFPAKVIKRKFEKMTKKGDI